jgi:hypothetical protein
MKTDLFLASTFLLNTRGSCALNCFNCRFRMRWLYPTAHEHYLWYTFPLWHLLQEKCVTDQCSARLVKTFNIRASVSPYETPAPFMSVIDEFV